MLVVASAASLMASADRLRAQAADPTPKPPLASPQPPPAFPGGPAPSPIPQPTTRPGPDASTRLYENAAGGWAISLPADWRVSAGDDPAFAILTSYDPATAAFQRSSDVRRGSAQIPTSELRVSVEAWLNPKALSPAAWVAASASSRTNGTVERLSQAPVTIAGQGGIALVQRELSTDGHARTIEYFVFGSRDASRIYIVSATPFESLRRAQLDAMLASLVVSR